jgi:hypothetical protein
MEQVTIQLVGLRVTGATAKVLHKSFKYLKLKQGTLNFNRASVLQE